MIPEFRLDDKKIDLNLVNPSVRRILEEACIVRSRYAYSTDFIIQAIHTSLARFAVNARLQYVPSGGNEMSTKMTTYYAMSFLGSSKGKDHFTDVIENELFHRLTDGFDKHITLKAIQRNSNTKDDMDKWITEGITPNGTPYTKKEYQEDVKTKFMATNIHDLGLRFGQATPEGLAYARNRIKMIDMGSPVLKIPEFSSAISNGDIKSLFTSLIELWENGNMSAKTTKDRLLPNCSNIPILFYAYTDPSKIINDEKKQRSLIDEFSSGMGRRTFIVFPDDSDFEERKVPFKNEIDETTIKSITYPIMKGISTFFNVPSNDSYVKPIQRFSSEAIEYMDKVNDCCREAEYANRGKMTDAELANLTAIGAKIEKLASLYAFIEGRVLISLDDCRYATYWSCYTHKYLGKISTVLTPPERLFNLLKQKKEFVSGFEIERSGIFDKSFDFNKKLDSTLANLSQYCAMSDYELLVSNKDGGSILKVREIPLVDENKLVTSYMIGSHEVIKKAGDNWKKLEFSFDKLEAIMTGDKELAITACELQDGKRLDDSATGRISFLALDFDDGLTLEDAKKRFSNYTYFLYTTRNHQKDKNGKVCDRFRVILLLERELILSKNEYKSMYQRILGVLAPEADASCVNISRIFFNSPNGLSFTNAGYKFKAHLFVDESKTEKVYRANTKLDGSGLKEYFLSEIDIVNTTRTGGVNLLVKVAFACKRELGIASKSEAVAYIKELSKLIFDEYWNRHSLNKEVLTVINKIYEEE